MSAYATFVLGGAVGLAADLYIRSSRVKKADIFAAVMALVVVAVLGVAYFLLK